MEELAVKKDFTDIYMQEFPFEYLKEMERLYYRIPDSTKPLYLSLAQQLSNNLGRAIDILDLGSSYGINSALMRYDLTMKKLDDFFLESKPTKQQTREFFESLPKDMTMNFYQIDISKPALDFSEHMGLCKKGLCVNLENNNLQLQELPPIDMVIATGCIGYIGYKAFANLLENIKLSSNSSESLVPKPLFAFSVLRIFDMEKIQKTFDYYGYSLVKTELAPICQRRFSDDDERIQTLSLLHNKGIETKRYEDNGYFYADFFIACPKRLEKQLVSMSKKMKKQSA